MLPEISVSVHWSNIKPTGFLMQYSLSPTARTFGDEEPNSAKRNETKTFLRFRAKEQNADAFELTS